MNRKRLFLALSMCIGATMFMACSDDDSDGQDNPEGEGKEYVMTTKSLYSHESCDSLIHVAGVEPTDSTDGVFPHWHCDECNRDYVDKDGKVLYKGSPFRPGKCHQIPKEILDKCNASVPWSDMVSGGTTRAGAGAVVLKVLKISSVVLNSKIQNNIKTGLKGVSLSLNSISSELSQIQTEVSHISSKTDKILQLLEALKEQNTVKDVYDQLDWLYKLSDKYYGIIDTKINRYTNNGAISVDDLSEADQASLGAEIEGVIRSWAETETNTNGASPVAITTDLLSTFNTMGMDGTTRIPFTEVLKKYVRTYRYWDDAGYYDRMQFLRFYQLSADMAAYLTLLYHQNVADMDKDLIASKNDSLYRRLDDLNKSITADSARMAEAYKNYRVFRNASRTVYLELQPVKGSLEQYFKKYLNDTDFNFADNSQLVPHIDDFLKSFTNNGDFITDDEIDDIYEAGVSYGQDTLSVIFKDHDLDMNPLKLKHPLLFPQRFGHRNNKKNAESAGMAETETAEISGFWVELKKHKHEHHWYNHYCAKEHDGKWFINYCNIWMNYSHADDNLKPKTDENDPDAITINDLWAIYDLSWSPWLTECDWRTCNQRKFYQTTPQSAKYVVTFRHYRGEVYD